METAGTFETPLTVYQFTLCHIPEDLIVKLQLVWQKDKDIQ
jgi:hypothetical protein